MAQLRVKDLPTIDERFWSKVKVGKPDECWFWIAGIKSTGRGNFSVGRRNIQAHRMAWLLTNGDIPEGMFLCHTCDNGLCVNPNHLYVGTPKENTADMINRNRKAVLVGEFSSRAKLTVSQVRQIRKMYSAGKKSQNAIAEVFGVSRSTIEAIILRRNWKSVE
ncbi:MAG TPA: HNH endonuclease [Bellilinea sp.]|nr:HNH endonuclease [Bellilinea sp.]